MHRTEIDNQLTDIIRDVLLLDDLVLRPDLAIEDVEGWDSFKMIEIVMAIELRLGIVVQSRELDAIACVGDLVSAVQSGKSFNPRVGAASAT